MSRKITTLIVTAAVLGITLVSSAAGKGNENKGRYYFRQNCKECHTKGAKGGEVTPLSRTMSEWRSFFAKGTMGKQKEPLTKIVPADQLVDVQAFLVGHAADSLQPETCGK
jgi:mono/diheme cytochrome c family protein